MVSYLLDGDDDRPKSIVNAIHDLGIPPQYVQAVYEPSKMQEEMILATMMYPDHRVYVETYHFTTPNTIPTDRLYDAVHALARRHAVLRSIYCWNDNADHMESSLTSIAVLDADYVGRQARLFWEYSSSDSRFRPAPVRFHIVGYRKDIAEERWQGEMPWKISVVHLPHGQGSILSLSYHHALMDGTTACRFLHSIHKELTSPGSATTESNFFVTRKELESRSSPQVQLELHKKLSPTKPNLRALGGSVSRARAGQGELTRSVRTDIPLRAGSAAVPAWMARLALAITLCTLQGTKETVFQEITSGRGVMSEELQRTFGLMIVPQIRWVNFASNPSLSQVSKYLRSSNDINHAFSMGQLRSLFPGLTRHLEVCFTCQTDDSYPYNGVGDWEWSGREIKYDIPITVELLPPKQGTFDISTVYDREKFTAETIQTLHELFCASLDWVQDYRAQLEDYDLAHAVDCIRAGNKTLDSYIGSTSTDVFETQEEYWTRELGSSKPAEFHCDRSRPEIPSGKMGVLETQVKGALHHALQHFSKNFQTTPFISLLAAFRAAHYRMTGTDDATIGAFGPFSNVQCMRVHVEEESTFAQLVKHIKSKVAAALAHEEVPLETIVPRLQPAVVKCHNPLIQTLFAVHTAGFDDNPLKVIHAGNENAKYATNFDIEVHLYQSNEGLEGEIVYAADLFHPRTIETVNSVFLEILERGMDSSGTRIEDIALSNGHSSLYDMGLMKPHRTDYPRDSTIIDVFSEQVVKNPHAVAVKDASGQLTYSELDQRSDELARWFHSRGYAPETFIAVLAQRSCQTIISFFGILKANLAYLPLDLKFPAERVKTILSSVEGPILVLTGQDVQCPDIALENLELVSIQHALDAGSRMGSFDIAANRPTAHSLAEVIYTSGSTGRPKGVLVEHRCIVSCVKNSNIVREQVLSSSFAHISSIAFDSSTWEIYGPLLNGGRVVCIDQMSALNYGVIQDIFSREKIRSAFITPALLKQYLVEAPSALAELHTLCVGGERSDPDDMYKALSLVQDEVIHVYGPTENTIYSTAYPLRKGAVRDEYSKYTSDRGVPIGRAARNSGAYIVDRQKRIVPLGVMGELVVVGDGLARGYTDPVKTRENFVMIEINGEQVRAYCTGDRVRYRPADGQIEYCGRMDYQIKIRGFRVELGEIEHALLSSGLVDEAAVIMRKPEGQEAQLLGFVTEKNVVDVSHHKCANGEREQEQEEGWKEIFTSTTYNTAIETHQAGSDFTGWKSMYDGKDIDKTDMNEWLDDTMATIRNGLPSGNVLEIGTGSGMILFNLTEGLERYVGLDPVPSIVDFVQNAVAQIVPELADRIEVHVGMATDLDKLEGTRIQPDLVVVNSVAQYFPSADYTLQVLQGLLGASKSKTICFGDMRSWALYDQFQVTKALYNEGNKASKSAMRQSIEESMGNETEFLADPAFFTSLSDRFPGLIRHVEIIPKRMRATNELSCYRFAAVIHTVHQHRHLPVHEVGKDQWIDFALNGLTHGALRDILRNSPNTSVVAIANIPHSKTILERHIANSMSSYDDIADSDSEWISLLRQEANKCPSLSALELVELGRQTGFRVEVSWARQFSQKGGLDAVFHDIQPAHGMERTMFRFPTDHESRPSHGFTSSPMEKKCSPNLDKVLRATLQRQLPSYMVPAVIKVLDELPINNCGKVDRRALSDMADAGQVEPVKDDTGYVAARNEWERAICEEFTNVLGTRVGIEHNFFDLGGHSLLATRATSKIVRRLACTINVKDLFDCPTPEALARRICSNDNSLLHDDDGEDGPSHDDIPQQLEVVGWREVAKAVGLSTEDVVDVMPCTPFQEGVLSTDMALEGASVYRSKLKIEFSADLNVDTLQSAWRATVEQEDMLRTAFLPVTKPLRQNGICGSAFLQAIFNINSPEVRRASSLHGVTSSTTVDLGIGHIPVSFGIIEGQSSEEWSLELTIHHALQDGSYICFVLDRLSRNYHQASNGKHAEVFEQQRHIPFSTFVRDLQDTDPHENSSFWKTYLHGAPVVTWPVASGLSGPLESNRMPEIKKVEWKNNARNISKKLHNTAAGIARAAVALTIATHSDSDDVVLGEVSSGRSHDGFIAGPCIATHPVRIQLSDSNNKRISLEKLLTRARNSYLDTIPYQQSGLLPIRKVTQNPEISPFQVLFVCQQLDKKSDSLFKFTPVIGSSGQLDFPLIFEVACNDTTGHLEIQCVFDPVLVPSTDVGWILQHAVGALDMMADGVTSGLGIESKLPTTRKEQEVLQEFANGWGDAEGMNTVDEIIHQRAIKMPERIALQFENKEYLTYWQLDTMSTRIATGIRRLLDGQVTHSSSQPLIPIFFKKSVNMVVSILAVLKAGAAFVPLNVDNPVKRLEAIFAATKPKVLIWDGIHGGEKLNTLSNSTGAYLYTRNDLEQISESLHNLRPSSLDALAYIVFTSGSTGTPKGVLVEHRSLAAFALSNEGSNDCSWTSNRLAWLEYTFDAAIGDIFSTLCKGGRLSLVGRENLFSRLTGWLDDLYITHLALTPTMGTLLTKDLHDSQRLAFLNTMIFGGEPFQPNFLRHAPKDLTIWNGYGPSETTIEVSACLLQERGVNTSGEPAFVPIGKPTRGCQIHILRPGTDEQVHVGGVGEMCISGPQLARGYIGHSGSSSNPFQQHGKNRIYRTGDLGRLHGDGLLEYLGRIDSQVKLRGLRIDLHELSSVALSHPLINACAVTKVDRNGRETLIAFVETDQEASFNEIPFAKVVRNHIAQHVPSYMIPDHYCIQTDPLPRTASGKMDMKAIRQMGEEKYGSCIESARNKPDILICAEPGTLEAKISSLWSQALGVEDDLDITTPFVHMGGDSLSAIILLALLRQNDIHLSMKDLSQSSTIQMQAARIRDTKTSNDEGVPDHLHVHRRQHSKGTIVLIHPFLAQSTILEPLVPLLDDRLDVILIDDPFFGKPECPRTITEWAHSYLNDIKTLVDPIEPVYLAGYSIGGQIAFEMALLWEDSYKRQPDSVILLDPGSYGPESPSMDDSHQREAAIRNSLGMLGLEAENLTLFEQHYDRLATTVRKTRKPPLYQGLCLYLTLPERLQDGIAEWWQSRCVDLSTHIVPCDNHFKLLNEDHIHLVSHFINTHCQMSMSSSPSVSPSEQGSSSSETSVEKFDKEVDYLALCAQGGKLAEKSSLEAF